MLPPLRPSPLPSLLPKPSLLLSPQPSLQLRLPLPSLHPHRLPRPHQLLQHPHRLLHPRLPRTPNLIPSRNPNLIPLSKQEAA